MHGNWKKKRTEATRPALCKDFALFLLKAANAINFFKAKFDMEGEVGFEETGVFSVIQSKGITRSHLGGT